ncbi:MAG TPA: 16S rRNA (guanine(966)-N(2))-methyltransferase RsmD [Acidimicrobiia bacterium]|jgi:16S rRNA (guanine966-N2)-methyltransferase
MARGLHVVAGDAKGARLVAPRGARPTTGRVREALFSALGNVTGSVVLELYAGSGALAVEALSRGAARAVLVDCDRAAVAACTANLEATRATDRATVLASTVSAVLARRPPRGAPFDLVVADPPYDIAVDEVQDVLAGLRAPGWLAPEARVVVERPARAAALALPDEWRVAWQRKYGDTLVVVLHEQG